MVKDLLWLVVVVLLLCGGCTHSAAFLFGMWWMGFWHGFWAGMKGVK